jgi:hypothetical protein
MDWLFANAISNLIFSILCILILIYLCIKIFFFPNFKECGLLSQSFIKLLIIFFLLFAFFLYLFLALVIIVPIYSTSLFQFIGFSFVFVLSLSYIPFIKIIYDYCDVSNKFVSQTNQKYFRFFKVCFQVSVVICILDSVIPSILTFFTSSVILDNVQSIVHLILKCFLVFSFIFYLRLTYIVSGKFLPLREKATFKLFTLTWIFSILLFIGLLVDCLNVYYSFKSQPTSSFLTFLFACTSQLFGVVLPSFLFVLFIFSPESQVVSDDFYSYLK